jgi:hypothetical protein
MLFTNTISQRGVGPTAAESFDRTAPVSKFVLPTEAELEARSSWLRKIGPAKLIGARGPALGETEQILNDNGIEILNISPRLSAQNYGGKGFTWVDGKHEEKQTCAPNYHYYYLLLLFTIRRQ